MAVAEYSELQLREFVREEMDRSRLAVLTRQGQGDQASLEARVGVLEGWERSRGKSIIATSQSRTNTAYGTLTTPDQVTGIVMPTDGVIVVLFNAVWQQATTGADVRAGIFLNGTQLVRGVQNAVANAVQEADLGGTGARDTILTTYPLGLVSAGNSAGSYSGVATTGQSFGLAPDTTDTSTTWGGACFIFAAAGTYTVDIRYKASSGSVTAKDRKLFVWSMGF